MGSQESDTTEWLNWTELNCTDMESKKMLMMNLFAAQQWSRRYREQTFEDSGGRIGRDELREKHWNIYIFVVQLLSRVRLLMTHPMDCSTAGFPVFHYLPEFIQTHVHQVSDAI